MKEKLQINISKIALILLITLGNITLFAQPPGGPPNPGGGAAGGYPPCWEPECVPVDGGIVFLLFAGVALALTMLYSKYKTAQ